MTAAEPVDPETMRQIRVERAEAYLTLASIIAKDELEARERGEEVAS